LWVPLTDDDAVFRGGLIPRREAEWLNVLGKRRRGVTLGAAQEELNTLMQQIAIEYPDSHRGPNSVLLSPLWRSPFGANVYLASSLPVLLGLAGIVLLLACANVATLLLVRSVSRRREIAIRLSLGASRGRVMQQLMLESVILSLAGGALAAYLTTWTAGTFQHFIPANSTPITLNGHVDGTVLLATGLMAALTGLLFGILPAVRTSHIAPIDVLKQEAGTVSVGSSRARLFSGLVVAQIAMSLVLLVCAGLFLRTLRNTQIADPGFRPSHLLLATVDLGQAQYSDQDGIAFQRQLLTRLQALPGVDSVAVADWVPLSLTRRTNAIIPEGYTPRLHESMETRRAAVTPNYFKTMGIDVLSGRDFTEQDDTHSQPVAIVDQTMANLYWPGGRALGHRLRINDQWFTIVGVVRNSHHHRLTEGPEPMVYKSLYQFPQTPSIIHVRTTTDPKAMAKSVESTVHAVDGNLPVFDVMSLESSMRLSNLFERIGGVLVGSFGMIALVLAAVGIYGVVAYTTRQRTHELGIRIALGASRGQILRLVMGQGVRLIAVGLAIGLAISLGVTRLLRSALYGVSAMDPVTLVCVSLLLAAVGLLACYAPALRAMRIDPTRAVRTE
jgi:predicted permease